MERWADHGTGNESARLPFEQVTLSSRIASAIKPVPDFPKIGVNFQDMSSFYAAPALVRDTAIAMTRAFADRFNCVLALEARGFPIGTAVAQQCGMPLVLARKPGKLPGEVHSMDYELEYGMATLEIQQSALRDGMHVLIIDDVLATGGTFEAAALLAKKGGAEVSGFSAILEISALNGRHRLAPQRVFVAHSVV
ncbi:adenine phosphoribosyltransferase [Streptomyces sp. NPDC057555]|uniref:Adenine phosphoribosyltransferase n=1 Tax=Streptomyces sp. JCM 9888 TaxID=1570103 RepID=A0A0B5H614_9ACTN|nr:Adenine phosphoribosyl-transferase [Streptomyces sp. JCM 9888]